METLLRIALSNTACAAVLAVGATAAGWSMRRPALTHALWVLVLLKLLTPPIWNVAVWRAAPPPHDAGIVASQVASDVVLLPLTTPSDTTKHHVGAERLFLTWLAPLTVALWGAGSVWCVLATLRRLRRFTRVLGHGVPAPLHLQHQVDELAERLALRAAPAAHLLPGRICPMIWAGLGRPRLLLPADLWHSLNPRQRSTLLLHELAHVKRGDHWVRLLELAATAVYWWNPLLWWSRRELRKAEEQCCDAWVAWAMPADADIYAAALVQAVDFASSSRPVLPALASGVGEFRHLKRRLVMIQQGNNNKALGWMGAIFVCAVAIILPLAPGRAQSSESSSPARGNATNAATRSPDTQSGGAGAADAKTKALLDRSLPEVRFDGVGLGDVIDFLRDVSGANIVVAWKSIEDHKIDRNTPVTARLHNVKFATALSAILTSAAQKEGALVYRVEDGVIVITVPGDGPTTPVVFKTYDVHDLIGGNRAQAHRLQKMIVDSVDPGSWKDTGIISYENGKLKIGQTAANQESIAKLLDDARELLKAGPRP